MDRNDVYTRLKDVFIDIFDDRRIKISDETTSKDIMGWDSLTHINLIAAVEDEFSINFSVEEAANFKNVGEMIDAILKLL